VIDKNDDPSAVSSEAAFMADERALVADLMGGTGAMRRAAKRHLPKHPAESDDCYAYRLSVSTLYNGLRRTVETMAGKPFSEPIEMADTVPPTIVEWCNDIDLQGRDLHTFAHSVFTAALADGLSHILVEYPPTVPGATLADKQATGARPYFLHLRHGQILGWRSERIAGADTLTQLRFMEQVTEPAGEFGTARIAQVRVLEPRLWRTYRTNEKGEWVKHDEGVVTLGAIPLATAYAGRECYMQARPPLLDLAYLNVEHWQSSSDQSNILHVARVPILFASGFDDGNLKIGAASAVSNDNPNAKLAYVEHSGAAIAAGRDSLKDIEERMSLMGAQLLVKKPGARTATEKAIDSADADSALALMARTLEDTIDQALQYMADWEGLGPAGEVELMGEIGGLDDMEIEALMRARELGILSSESVFGEMQRRGLVSDGIDWAGEAARLKAEGSALASGAAKDGAAGAPRETSSAPPPTPPAPDFQPLIDSISSLVQAIGTPQPAPVINNTINVPEQPAPIVNFTAGDVNVTTPDVHVAPAAITVEGAQITNTPPAVTVEGSTINVQPAPYSTTWSG
jgi:hypothetical protein